MDAFLSFLAYPPSLAVGGLVSGRQASPWRGPVTTPAMG